MFPYYNPQYCPSTSEDSSFLPQLAKPPAAVQAVRVSESEHSSASKMWKVLFLFSFFLVRWPRSTTFFHSMFMSILYSKSCTLRRFSELFLFFPHSKSTSEFFKWRFPLPLTPAHQGLWRGLIATSSALSWLGGGGERGERRGGK